MMTGSTMSPAMPARASAAAMANPPSSAALNPASAPDILAMGVRAPATMTDPGMGYLRCSTCAPVRVDGPILGSDRWRCGADPQWCPRQRLRTCTAQCLYDGCRECGSNDGLVSRLVAASCMGTKICPCATVAVMNA